MVSDWKPIIFNTPKDFEFIEIYFAHDIHYGSNLADMKKWERFKSEILDKPYRYIIWCGDYCDTALINSKSNIYEQTQSLENQRLWMQQQFTELKDRTIVIVPGNHENRITKNVGLFPVYDSAVCAGVENQYRQHFAFVDIGVGSSGYKDRQTRYVGYVTHRLRDCKTYHGGDFIDGVDFIVSGHDHDPHDHARSKLFYNSTLKYIGQKDVEIIDSGSFLTYGGYGVESGYRPQATKLYKLVLYSGKNKMIHTVGYHI